MKAFWCVRPVVENSGELSPSFPAGFVSSYQVCGDIRVFGNDPAPADHRHAQINTLAVHDTHYHQIFWNDGQDGWYQEWFGTDPGAVKHSHDISIYPSNFLVFVLCSDAMYSLFMSEVGEGLVIGHADVTAEDGQASIGEIDNTAWDGPTRTAWENRVDNFGIDLPVVVTNSRRFARWILASFVHVGQNIKSDTNYRYTSYTEL